MGADGRGTPYGLSTGKFASQSETIEVHTPELNVARTAVLDYFTDLQNYVPQHNEFFCWENGNTLCTWYCWTFLRLVWTYSPDSRVAQIPEASCQRFLSQVCTELGNSFMC